jgi:hypothetical protein
MLIDPVYIGGGATRASTNVLVESELQIVAQVQASVIGAPMSVSVLLTHAGSIVSSAQVRVKLMSPTTSLSQLSTPIVRHRAAAADVRHIPPALQILTKTTATQYEAHFEKREYITKLPTPSVDGVYHAEVVATGKACGGVFERYWSTSFYVGLHGKQRLARIT